MRGVMDALSTLAAFAAELRFDQLPEPVVAQARRVLIDTLGAAIAGSAEPEVQALSRALARGGAARIVGTPRRAAAGRVLQCPQRLLAGTR
ncbi:MAG: MmgE/PrpD family protein [Chloroflexi bacterium]|nr:MmgE/PrpD family protein [Chloroflexota bacterium]